MSENVPVSDVSLISFHFTSITVQYAKLSREDTDSPLLTDGPEMCAVAPHFHQDHQGASRPPAWINFGAMPLGILQEGIGTGVGGAMPGCSLCSTAPYF